MQTLETLINGIVVAVRERPWFGATMLCLAEPMGPASAPWFQIEVWDPSWRVSAATAASRPARHEVCRVSVQISEATQYRPATCTTSIFVCPELQAARSAIALVLHEFVQEFTWSVGGGQLWRVVPINTIDDAPRIVLEQFDQIAARAIATFDKALEATQRQATLREVRTRDGGRKAKGAAIPKVISRLQQKLAAANGKLFRQLSMEDVLRVLKASLEAKNGLAWATPSVGYAWASRKVPLVLAWFVDKQISVRFLRASYRRGSGGTPASFSELRGFPRGDVIAKLEKWRSAEDTVTFAMAEVRGVCRKVPEVDDDGAPVVTLDGVWPSSLRIKW